MAKRSKRRSPPARGKVDESPLPGATAQRYLPWIYRRWFWALVLILAVILIYQPVWRAGFVWDDDMFTSANPCIVGPLGLKEIWTTSAARFYPLILTTFWLEHALWGLAPSPYHLANILLHAACALVLWQVLRHLGVPGAWLGASLWAVHPVQVETVAWISEMKNTESCLFYLLTIFFFLRGLKDEATGQRGRVNWNASLSLTFGALAMASKASTLLLPVVLALCVWWLKGRWRWREMSFVGAFLLMSCSVSLIEMQTVRQNGTDEMQWAESWQERLANGGYVFWFYLGKLVWPHPLITFYPRWEIDPSRLISYLPLVTLVLVLSVLWLQRGSWSRPYFFAFAYYLLNLLPVMGLISMTGFRYALVEDHLQYLASMSPLALAGAGLSRFSTLASKAPWSRAAMEAGVLVLLGFLSWQQAWIYHDQHTLWTANLAKNPNSWLAENGLGVEMVEKGEVDQGIKFYRRSLAINPNYAVTHTNLGVALAQEGRTDEAIVEYRKALAINPNAALVHLKLGEALSQKGRIDEAIAEDQRALGLDPHATLAYNNLGLALVQKGETDRAIQEYRKALEIDPNFAMVRNNFGSALFQKGEVAEAIEQYQKALDIDSHISAVHENLAIALSQTGIGFLQRGRANEAIAQFQEALTNDPNLVQAHSNLGIAFAQTGQLHEALAEFQKAVRLRPDDSAAQADLARAKVMVEERESSP